MNKIYMDNQHYSDSNVISRKEKSNIEFNSKVVSPENSDIVVITEGTIRRLKYLDNGIINPKGGLNLFRKKDLRKHVIYFISKAGHEGRWGTNIQYDDYKINGIQEKVFIRTRFTYFINSGERTIALLSEKKDNYSNRYLGDKIGEKMDNCITESISRSLNSVGFVKTQENMTAITDAIKEKVNESIMIHYGISIKDMNIVIEEDREHAVQRNKFEWSNLLAEQNMEDR